MTHPIVIRIPGRPACLNAERSDHWSVRSELTAAVREETIWRARPARAAGRLPVLDVVAVRSWPTYTTKRSWPDVAGWMPATKAVIDGFVDAGVLANDRCEVVRRITFDPPRVGDTTQLVVVLIPWDRAAAGELVAIDDAIEVPGMGPGGPGRG